MSMMTSEEYLANLGNKCPFCNSDEIQAFHITADGKDAWCRVECDACGGTWEDIYKLVGFEPTPGGWDDQEEPDDNMDGDHQSALASAGFGTDEDYGGGMERL